MAVPGTTPATAGESAATGSPNNDLLDPGSSTVARPSPGAKICKTTKLNGVPLGSSCAIPVAESATPRRISAGVLQPPPAPTPPASGSTEQTFPSAGAIHATSRVPAIGTAIARATSIDGAPLCDARCADSSRESTRPRGRFPVRVVRANAGTARSTARSSRRAGGTTAPEISFAVGRVTVETTGLDDSLLSSEPPHPTSPRAPTSAMHIKTGLQDTHTPRPYPTRPVPSPRTRAGTAPGAQVVADV